MWFCLSVKFGRCFLWLLVISFMCRLVLFWSRLVWLLNCLGVVFYCVL